MKILSASNSSKLSFVWVLSCLQQEYVEDYNTATMPSKKPLWLQRLKRFFRPKKIASLEYCVLFANPPKLCLVWIGFPRFVPCTNIILVKVSLEMQWEGTTTSQSLSSRWQTKGSWLLQPVTVCHGIPLAGSFKTPNFEASRSFFGGVKNRRDHAVFHCRCNAPTVHTVAKESRTKRTCLVRQVPVLVVASESNQRHNTCWERRWRRKKKAETVIDTAAWLFWAPSYQLGATFERELFWDIVFQMLSIPALFLFVSFLVD